MLALDLNDIALTLVRDGTVLAAEPGFALLSDKAVLTGSRAESQARLTPILAHSRFWQQLSLEALPRPHAQAATFADLAFMQTASLAAALRSGASSGDVAAEVLVAVPPTYTREQLGLLIGVLREAGLSVVGLVDAAVAAATQAPVAARTVHLDFYLHQTVATSLELSLAHGGDLKRTRAQGTLQTGWLSLQARWVGMIAGEFVRRTRFDPLHHAQTEQLLWNGMPHWLDMLGAADEVQVEVQFSAENYAIPIRRSQIIAAAEAHYQEISELVMQARQIAGPMSLLLSAHAARAPGLAERLGDLRNMEIHTLPTAAGALGALAFESTIRRSVDALALVARLPVQRAADEATAPDSTLPAPSPVSPTHVLLDARAYAIGPEPLVIGRSVPPEQRALPIAHAENLAGVSRVHCSLVLEHGEVKLRDHSTYGTFINGERIAAEAGLLTGDRVTVGHTGADRPSLELLMIRIEPE